jgi:hypothetical protein
MALNTHFCILTPDGAITPDTFVIADKQPEIILNGCLLVVHQPSGRQFTVHRSRLIPINDPASVSAENKRHICSKYGKVEGIVLDKVTCPHHSGVDCGLLETRG